MRQVLTRVYTNCIDVSQRMENKLVAEQHKRDLETEALRAAGDALTA